MLRVGVKKNTLFPQWLTWNRNNLIPVSPFSQKPEETWFMNSKVQGIDKQVIYRERQITWKNRMQSIGSRLSEQLFDRCIIISWLVWVCNLIQKFQRLQFGRIQKDFWWRLFYPCGWVLIVCNENLRKVFSFSSGGNRFLMWNQKTSFNLLLKHLECPWDR